MKTFFSRAKSVAYQWDFADEEGREEIHQWSKDRQQHFRGINKTYHGFLVYTFSLNTIKSFLQNFNFMVIIQMILAGLSIYIFQRFDIYFDMNVYLYISPIVFPLAFSINTDFQRREKVLANLADFKTGCMFWYFCVREWKEAAELDENWINTKYTKIKSILFHLREYLLTERVDRRKTILNAMYEDISDCSQLIEEVRSSQVPTSDTIVCHLVTFLQAMTLSFEQLRVVREYRSPRSIRSFNKVLILLLPIIIAPYFVNQSRDHSGKIIHQWTPYYISILVSFVFSALQGVQDKLDDPFDGMSEDDINLKQIDEWTFNSLQATVNRSFKVGRFQVNNVDCQETILNTRNASLFPSEFGERKASSIALFRSNSLATSSRQESLASSSEIRFHPYADVLEKISGVSRIENDGTVLPVINESNESSELRSLDSPTQATDSIGLQANDSNGEAPNSIDDDLIQTHTAQKELHLEGLFRNSNENDSEKIVKNHRKISFNENPIILSAKSPEDSLESPKIPLLRNNRGSLKSKFKLKHMNRFPSYFSRSTSQSPVTEMKSSPETDLSIEITAGETIFNGNENSNGNTIQEVVLDVDEDSNGYVGNAKIDHDCIPPTDDKAFVLIDNNRPEREKGARQSSLNNNISV